MDLSTLKSDFEKNATYDPNSILGDMMLFFENDIFIGDRLL
jgi:hypothetical protein